MCEMDKMTAATFQAVGFKQSKKYFTVTFKTKDKDFSFIVQGKDDNPNHPDHMKKKSPSQKKRGFEIRNLFFENKLEKSHMSLQFPDDSNTKIHIEEPTPPFK